MNRSLIKGAGGEREEDGISAADHGKVVDRIRFGPMNDVAERAVRKFQVPVHQPGAFLGPGEKSRIANLPAPDFSTKVIDPLHLTMRKGGGAGAAIKFTFHRGDSPRPALAFSLGPSRFGISQP